MLSCCTYVTFQEKRSQKGIMLKGIHFLPKESLLDLTTQAESNIIADFVMHFGFTSPNEILESVLRGS